MFCKNCGKRDSCLPPCEALEKHLGKFMGSHRETLASAKGQAGGVQSAIESLNTWSLSDTTWSDKIEKYQGDGRNAYKYPILSDLQNRILWLFSIEGLPYKQIAQRVGKKETVVRGQISRAREKLKSKYSGCSYEEEFKKYRPPEPDQKYYWQEAMEDQIEDGWNHIRGVRLNWREYKDKKDNRDEDEPGDFAPRWDRKKEEPEPDIDGLHHDPEDGALDPEKFK